MSAPTSSTIALTFEAGGSPEITSRILEVLKAAKAPATIFLLGRWAANHPDLVKRMAADGHEFGNHSYNHPDLTELPDEAVRMELDQTNTLAQQLTGQAAFPWLRPPYGKCDERVQAIVTAQGYHLMSKDALDGIHWPDETTAESVFRRSLQLASEAGILTYHLNNELTLQTLDRIIDELRRTGYEFTTLSVHQADKHER